MHPITLTSKPSQVHPPPLFPSPEKRGGTTSNLCLYSMELGQTPSSQPLKETESFPPAPLQSQPLWRATL